jgi:hypothetical protein
MLGCLCGRVWFLVEELLGQQDRSGLKVRQVQQARQVLLVQLGLRAPLAHKVLLQRFPDQRDHKD